MYLKINAQKNKENEISTIVDSLNDGLVLAYPSDTIYGLGCLSTDSKAILKIKEIKKRDAKKPLLVLVSSLAMVKRYCYISKEQEQILKKIWTKARPTSVILKHRNLLSSELVSNNDGLAVRLPKSDFLRKIVRRIKVPLVSTSFNVSGQPVINRVDNLEFNYKKVTPDLIIDGGILKGKASQLLDLRGEKILIIRK